MVLADSRFIILLTLGICFVFFAIQICNHQQLLSNFHDDHVMLFDGDYEVEYHYTQKKKSNSSAAPKRRRSTDDNNQEIKTVAQERPRQEEKEKEKEEISDSAIRTIRETNPSLVQTRGDATTMASSLHEAVVKTKTTKQSRPLQHKTSWNRPSTICPLTKPLDEITYSALQKLRRGIIQNQQKLAAIPTNITRPKILCMVYTHQGAHDNYLRAIVDTWGKQCDGFFAASNVTDPSLGAIRLEFPGPESYGNMWQKVLTMWKYAHDNYLDDYDYFHICGDDTFVIPDNMRLFLMSKQVEDLKNGYLDDFSFMSTNKDKWKNARPRPLLFGFPLQVVVHHRIEQFPAGGSGYTLNREALKVFYKTINDHPSNDIDSREDMMMARWLSLSGITCSDTRDEFGAFRYVTDNLIAEYKCLHKWPGRDDQDSKVMCHDGLDGFSYETVSIHINYRKSRWLPRIVNYTEEVMYRFDDMLSGKCDGELLSHVPNQTKMELLYDMGQRAHFKWRRVKALGK
jgi:hypothetical protein